MNILLEVVQKGGISMWILSLCFLFLSILSLSVIIERGVFWYGVLSKQEQVLTRIMEAASRNWDLAPKIARDYRKHPIGNYLYAPLKLDNPEPEVFHLALEAAADDELALMRRGDKVLEAAIAIAPLLGLLGTVTGLIISLRNIQISDLGTSSTTGVTLGISEALVSTAAGLIVAITSLVFFRLFQSFWFSQVRLFRKVGSDLEVLYRQRWMDLEDNRYPVSANLEKPKSVDN